MIKNIKEIPKNVSGIYKINYDNGKIYIGQALNIYNRALEHNSKNNQLCDKALKKHNAKIEILEIVQNAKYLDEIETKWIVEKDATNRNKGYNILKQGNASNKRGCDNPNASLNKEQLEEIWLLLKNRLDISISDISKQFKVDQSVIVNINRGKRYVNPNFKYPLRPNDNKQFLVKNTMRDYNLTENQVIKLKEDLLYNWELTIEIDLPKKYNIPKQIVREINQGRFLENIGNYTYPIRKKNIRNNLKLTQEDVKNILSLLKDTNMTMTQIGDKYDIYRGTISKINQGTIYPIKDYHYPAR